MYLTKINKDRNKTNTHIEFEKVAADLLMISFDNDINDQARVFSYWCLLGSGVNPPLMIGVNTETGTIKSITFFVDSDCFKEYQFEHKNTLPGNIMVDSSIFSKANDYVNNKGNYFVALDGNRLMCKFSEECDIKETIVNENIEFHMDNENLLRGFTINGLTDSEIEAITSLL